MPIQEFLFTVDPRTDKNLSSINGQLRSLTNREDPLSLENFISFDVIGYSGLRSVVIRVTMEVNTFYARSTFPVNGAAFSQVAAPSEIKFVFNAKVNPASITDTSIKINTAFILANNITLESDGYTLSVINLLPSAIRTHTIELISLKDERGNNLSKQDVFSYVVGTSGSSTSDRGNPRPYTYNDKLGDFKVASFVLDRYAKIADKITEYLTQNNIDRDSIIAQDTLSVNENTLEVYILYFSDLFPSVIRTFPQEGALVSSESIPTEAVITLSQPTHINITETNNITLGGIDISTNATLSDDKKTIRVALGAISSGNHYLKINNIYNALGRIRPNPPTAIGFTADDIADNGGTGGGGSAVGGTGISGVIADGGIQVDGVTNPVIYMTGGDSFISTTGAADGIAIYFDESQIAHPPAITGLSPDVGIDITTNITPFVSITGGDRFITTSGNSITRSIDITFDESKILFPADHVTSGVFDSEGIVVSDGAGSVTITGTVNDYVSGIALTGVHIDGTVSVLPDGTGNLNITGFLTGHPIVTPASDQNNAGNTFIQDISFDEFGHAIGIASGTVDLGSISHASLLNLDGDDHPQYLTTGRGDFLYYRESDVDGFISGITDSLASGTGAGILYIASGDSVSKFDNDAGYWTVHSGVTNAITGLAATNNNFIQAITSDINGHLIGIVANAITPDTIGALDTGDLSSSGAVISQGDGSISITGTLDAYISNINITGENISGVVSIAPGGTGNIVVTGFSAGITEETDPLFSVHVASNITTTNTANWSDAYVHSTGTGANPHGVSIGNISGGTFAQLDTAITNADLVKSGDNISFFNNDSGYINAHPSVLGAFPGVDNVGTTVIQSISGDSLGHMIGATSLEITPPIIGAIATSQLNASGFIISYGTGAVDDAVATSNYYDSSKVDAISGAISAEIDSDINIATSALYTTTTGYVNFVSGVLTNEIDTDINIATSALYTTTTGYINTVSGDLRDDLILTGGNNANNISINSADISYVSGVFIAHTGSKLNPHAVSATQVGAYTVGQVDIISGALSGDIFSATGGLYTTIADIGYVEGNGLLVGGSTNRVLISDGSDGIGLGQNINTYGTGSDIDQNASDILVRATGAQFDVLSGSFDSHSGAVGIHYTKDSISLNDLGNVTEDNINSGALLWNNGGTWVELDPTTSGYILATQDDALPPHWVSATDVISGGGGVIIGNPGFLSSGVHVENAAFIPAMSPVSSINNYAGTPGTPVAVTTTSNASYNDIISELVYDRAVITDLNLTISHAGSTASASFLWGSKWSAYLISVSGGVHTTGEKFFEGTSQLIAPFTESNQSFTTVTGMLFQPTGDNPYIQLVLEEIRENTTIFGQTILSLSTQGGVKSLAVEATYNVTGTAPSPAASPIGYPFASQPGNPENIYSEYVNDVSGAITTGREISVTYVNDTVDGDPTFTMDGGLNITGMSTGIAAGNVVTVGSNSYISNDIVSGATITGTVLNADYILTPASTTDIQIADGSIPTGKLSGIGSAITANFADLATSNHTHDLSDLNNDSGFLKSGDFGSAGLLRAEGDGTFTVTSDVTTYIGAGTITNNQLSGNIANSKLQNSAVSVSYSAGSFVSGDANVGLGGTLSISSEALASYYTKSNVNIISSDISGQINQATSDNYAEITSYINNVSSDITGYINSVSGDLTGYINTVSGDLTGYLQNDVTTTISYTNGDTVTGSTSFNLGGTIEITGLSTGTTAGKVVAVESTNKIANSLVSGATITGVVLSSDYVLTPASTTNIELADGSIGTGKIAGAGSAITSNHTDFLKTSELGTVGLVESAGDGTIRFINDNSTNWNIAYNEYGTGSHVNTISGLFTGHSGETGIHFILRQSVTNGITDEAVSADAIYDYVDGVSGDIAGGAGSTTFISLTDTPSSIVNGTFYYGSGSNLTGLPTGTNNQRAFIQQGSDGFPVWGDTVASASESIIGVDTSSLAVGAQLSWNGTKFVTTTGSSDLGGVNVQFLSTGGTIEYRRMYASDIFTTGFYGPGTTVFADQIRPITYSDDGAPITGGGSLGTVYSTNSTGQSYYETDYIYVGDINITNIELGAALLGMDSTVTSTYKIYAVEVENAVTTTGLIHESEIVYSPTDDGVLKFATHISTSAANLLNLKSPRIFTVFEDHNTPNGGIIDVANGAIHALSIEVEYTLNDVVGGGGGIGGPRGSAARTIPTYYQKPLNQIYLDKTATGDQTISGSLIIPAGKTLTVTKTPGATLDAVNKSYVDDLGDTKAALVDFNAHTASGTVHFTEASIDHTAITGIGTNTHAQIDTHIASTVNPHATDIGNLGAGTLAELNAAVTDATLDNSSASRPPNGSAGGSLGGTYPNPVVNDGADGTAVHDNTAGEILAITEKGTPVSADLLIIEDSAAGNVKKRVQIGNLPGGGGSSDLTPAEAFAWFIG